MIMIDLTVTNCYHDHQILIPTMMGQAYCYQHVSRQGTKVWAQVEIINMLSGQGTKVWAWVEIVRYQPLRKGRLGWVDGIIRTKNQKKERKRKT